MSETATVEEIIPHIFRWVDGDFHRSGGQLQEEKKQQHKAVVAQLVSEIHLTGLTSAFFLSTATGVLFIGRTRKRPKRGKRAL